MTLRLTVDEQPWREHVDTIRRSVDGLVPVVKGNGYGFGRQLLVDEVAGWAAEAAVGTVHEALHLPAIGATRWLCLTPSLDVPGDLPDTVVPTVGRSEHADALAAVSWSKFVSVKLATSMHRYGVEPDGLQPLLAQVLDMGASVHSFVIHPPLPDEDRPDAVVADIEAWLPHLHPSVALSVSHLDPEQLVALRRRHPTRTFQLRMGTALWHGDKSFLRLTADVVDIRPVDRGCRAGYRSTPVPADGHLVMIGAGSSHGVAPLPDGRSPFHFARHRMSLHEPPHMHTSMAFVPIGEPLPVVGDHVDVQRPLITTAVDVVTWR